MNPRGIHQMFSIFVLVVAATTAGAQAPDVGHTAKINGMVMYYEIVGEGEPMLLLHSGTQSSRMWDAFVERFSERYRLIIPDLRGHGGSNNPQGLWTTFQFAADVFALLDHLGVNRVRAMGASAGAMTLLRMATQQPDRVESMVVIGVGTYIPAECRATLGSVTTEGLSDAAWGRLRARHTFGDDQIRALYSWVASLAESYNDMTFEPPLLATITAPTLVVHGDRDYCFPASMAWDIYRAIPDSALWVVPNGSHVPIDGSNAERFADIALEFVE
jgi:pimeloyl-ACP methyl ester carboxylesterase